MTFNKVYTGKVKVDLNHKRHNECLVGTVLPYNECKTELWVSD